MPALDNISRPLLDPLFMKFVEMQGSDLYLTVGHPPSLRVSDRITQLGKNRLTDADIDAMVEEILDAEKREEFASTMELNISFAWGERARFRVNLFRQQQHNSMVMRRIQTNIPTIESLHLPRVYGDLIMEKGTQHDEIKKVYSDLIMETRGLVLVVGPTGSGKSSSVAAMIGHRNQHGYGHVVTVEDPIEFIHQHNGCIISQRDIGIDTHSFGMALKNVLRQRPDVVVIGEIRDRETMEHALHFSESGHLCVATLHAGNTKQALESILNFFPEEKHVQVRYNLANCLKGILSQRLVLTPANTRMVAVEVMLNRGLIRSLIEENRLQEIPDVMARNRGEGMQTFDQALYQLFLDKFITEEVALAESDNPANIRLLIRQHQNTKRFGSVIDPPIAPAPKPQSGSTSNF